MRIKKIAERRTIWGGGRRRRKSAARWTMTSLERRLIDDDDGAAPASHYSTIASHRDLRRCHDGGTARPRSPRARPTSSLRERPGRVRSCSSSPLDLTSGRPARGLHAPPGPNGLLQGRHVPPALLPHIVLLLPRVSFLSPPSAHKEFAVEVELGAPWVAPPPGLPIGSDAVVASMA